MLRSSLYAGTTMEIIGYPRAIGCSTAKSQRLQCSTISRRPRINLAGHRAIVRPMAHASLGVFAPAAREGALALSRPARARAARAGRRSAPGTTSARRRLRPRCAGRAAAMVIPSGALSASTPTSARSSGRTSPSAEIRTSSSAPARSRRSRPSGRPRSTACSVADVLCLIARDDVAAVPRRPRGGCCARAADSC